MGDLSSPVSDLRVTDFDYVEEKPSRLKKSPKKIQSDIADASAKTFAE